MQCHQCSIAARQRTSHTLLVEVERQGWVRIFCGYIYICCSLLHCVAHTILIEVGSRRQRCVSLFYFILRTNKALRQMYKQSCSIIMPHTLLVEAERQGTVSLF